MDKFSANTSEKLKFYVYILLDPRDNKIFYVGKGKGNRIFAHIRGALDHSTDSERLNLISEIFAEGKEVKHFILRHGIEDESVAYKLESTLIDLLTYRDYLQLSKISNLVSGHHALEFGIMTTNEVEAIYSSPPLEESSIKHNLLLITINRSLERGSSLYDATRKYWKLSRERLKKVDYVCAVYRGIIRGIFKPDYWGFEEKEKRMYFEGTEVTDNEILGLYLNKEYTGKKKGTQNPIRYLFKQ